MPASTVDRETSTATVRKHANRYKVLLHDDPVNTIDYVIVTVMKVMAYPETRATEITMEVHTTGSSVVTVCDFEPAEHYCECFKAKGLTSSIEKE
jgi:ATP-dependent Clp protease adaptor protein ClpS